MSTTVTYKGNTLTTVSNVTKTLKTAGKYMEGDVTLVDTSIDTSNDTVTTETLLQGYTAHNARGEQITGNARSINDINLSSVYITENGSYETSSFKLLDIGTIIPSGTSIYNYTYPELIQNLETWKANVSIYTSNLTEIIPEETVTWKGNDITLSTTDCSIIISETYATITTSRTDIQFVEIKPLFDAIGYIEVDVPTSSTINNQNKTITPSESIQSIRADSGYTGLGIVTVNAISSTYVGSEITQRDGDDLTVSGATVNVPAGYYSAAASKSVATGIEGAPTASKGTVTDNSITVTPSVTNTAGYISGGTHSGTAVTVSASELVSGTYSVTASGTHDVTNYASASVPAGSTTAPTSISGTAASVSTGSGTLTLTKTVSVTPRVTTAGYVTTGTAGNSSVTLTASVTTKAAATITPGTTNQTIAAGTYLTGTQTIAGDANLIGSNILSTASIFGVQGTVVIQNYYTGSSAPSSSLGSNGDIYIQS